jgi:hypothetical protein
LDFDAGVCDIYWNDVLTDVTFPIVNGISYWPVVHLYYLKDGFTFQFPTTSPFKNTNKPIINTTFGWTIASGNLSCFKLTNNNVKKIGGGNTWKNAMVYGSTSYSSGKVYFEVSLDSINSDGSGYVVGLSKSNQGSTQFSGDLAIGFAGSSYNLNGSQHGKKGKSGDVIGLELDFELGKCNFWYNSIQLDCWATIVSGTSYWPVVHLYYVGDECSLVQSSKPELVIPSNSLWNWTILDKTTSYAGHGGVLYNDEIYYFFGDEDNHISNKIFSIHKKTLEKKFITPMNSPSPRRQFSYDIYKNTIYIFGGNGLHGSTNDFWALNLDTMKWTQIFTESPPPLRCYHTCTVWNDRYYIFGGVSGDLHLDDLWYFDFEKGVWKECKTELRPKGRRYCTLNAYKKLFLFSGRDDVSRFNDVWEFHVETGLWKWIQATGDFIPKPMSAHTSVMYKQCLYVFGGNDGGNTLPNYFYRYNTVTSEWRMMPTTGSVPEGRYWHVSVMDPITGEMFIHGGMGITVATLTFCKIKVE